jgi:hypothetical protein
MGSRYDSYNMVDENNEPCWRTAQGDEIPFSQITHQHWSNIYWYHKYLEQRNEERKEKTHWLYSGFTYEEYKINFSKKCELALGQLNKRFNGELLDWVPMYREEKQWYIQQSTRKILLEKIKV